MDKSSSLSERFSDDQQRREVPSFIEPRPPVVSNPWMRPKPLERTNLLEIFDEECVIEEPELVQVYLRFKPCSGTNNSYEIASDKFLITSVDTAPAGHGRRTQHNISKMYTFSHIFGPDSSQKEIFEHVVKDNLKKLVDGHSYTLLTYGASGSGKTYTLMGTVSEPGLIPRSLEYLFHIVDASRQPLYKPCDGVAERLETREQEGELEWVRRLRNISAPSREQYRRMSISLTHDFTSSTFDLSNRTRYFVWVSFVEIYNEAVYDLLTSCDRNRSSAKLRICEDATGHVYVKGATQAFVRSGSEAHDVMMAGKHNLQVAATGIHANSSRSHCIFTITMLAETLAGVRTSCVRLCDLAGSERAARTQNTGVRMAESRAINTSLHVLERCLHTLRRKQRSRPEVHLVPYRESKLTRLLGSGLSGTRGEAVSMVVTVNPSPDFVQETRHVLQLAAVAKNIHVNNSTISASSMESISVQDSTVGDCTELIKLRAENDRLHFELQMADTRISELSLLMAEKQQTTAITTKELVEEAKDNLSKYYQSKITALEEKHYAEIEEIIEEYENKSRVLQKQTDQLTMEMTMEIAILKENLEAERLARAEENQHLLLCIAERDSEKATDEYEKKISQDALSIGDENDSETNLTSNTGEESQNVNNSDTIGHSEHTINLSSKLSELGIDNELNKLNIEDKVICSKPTEINNFEFDLEGYKHDTSNEDSLYHSASHINSLTQFEEYEKAINIDQNNAATLTTPSFSIKICKDDDRHYFSNITNLEPDDENIDSFGKTNVQSYEFSNMNLEGEEITKESMSILQLCIQKKNKSADMFDDDLNSPISKFSDIKKDLINSAVTLNACEEIKITNDESEYSNEGKMNDYKKNVEDNKPLIHTNEIKNDDLVNINKENCDEKLLQNICNYDDYDKTQVRPATEITYNLRHKISKGCKKNLSMNRKKKDNTSNHVQSFKDTVKLQEEYSDVTTGIPVKSKPHTSIASPEKLSSEEENIPPSTVQSCPAKSTRSRRKLFTPRVEPLDEVKASDGASNEHIRVPLDEAIASDGESNEHIRVPRPSYYPKRARRKLQKQFL